jgi:hypothetical protein
MAAGAKRPIHARRGVDAAKAHRMAPVYRIKESMAAVSTASDLDKGKSRVTQAVKA